MRTTTFDGGDDHRPAREDEDQEQCLGHARYDVQERLRPARLPPGAGRSTLEYHVVIEERPSRWNGRPFRLQVGRWPKVGPLVRTSPTGLVVLAIVTGAGAGLGAIAFRYLILWFTRAVQWPRGLQRRRPCAEPLRTGAGRLVRRPRSGRRRSDLRAAGPSVRAGGARAWRARGHARRGRARRPDPAAGRGRQVARVGALHRLGRLGRPRGADRADRLGARIDPRPAAAGVRSRGCGCCVACGAAGRDLGDVQRADRRGVLRAGADPARLRGRVVRASSCSPRSPPTSIGRAAFGSTAVPVAAGVPAHLAAASYGLYAGLGLFAAVVGVAFIRVLYGVEDVADRLVARAGVAAARGRRARCSACCCWRCPQMYGVGYPVLERADPRATTCRSCCCCCWSARSSRPA